MRRLRDRMRITIGTYTCRAVHLVTLTLLAAIPFGCHSQSEPRSSHSAVSAPPLGTAASFLVLGGSTVTNTGATTVYGDLGVSPGLAITGFPPGLVIGGAVHTGDAVALGAQNDVTAAYLLLAGEACASDMTGKDLGGLTLTQGVYCFSSEAQLTGQLVLDAQGDPSAVFVFQIASKLTTASNASVVFINGGQDCRAFWQVGSSATLGTDTVFVGSILALTSIALQTGASVSGRALARNGAVTMDTNHVFAGTCAGSGPGVDGSTTKPDAGIDSSVAKPDATAPKVDSSVAKPDSSGGGLCCGGVLCGTTCANLTADRANCGSCGHACLAGEICIGGSCASCAMPCAGECVNFIDDRNNCGSCGNVCPSGGPCGNGSCLPCPTLCKNVCVDLVNDKVNCGSCGHVCLASERCTGGSCVPCAQLCGGACVNLGNDSDNCGSCGHSCAPGESCSGGSCVCL